MTRVELIKELQKYNEDIPVVVHSGGSLYVSTKEVTEIKLNPYCKDSEATGWAAMSCNNCGKKCKKVKLGSALYLIR